MLDKLNKILPENCISHSFSHQHTHRTYYFVDAKQKRRMWPVKTSCVWRASSIIPPAQQQKYTVDFILSWYFHFTWYFINSLVGCLLRPMLNLLTKLKQRMWPVKTPCIWRVSSIIPPSCNLPTAQIHIGLFSWYFHFTCHTFYHY